MRFDAARILRVREAVQPKSGVAVAPRQFLLTHILQMRNESDAILRKTRLECRARPPDKTNRLVAQKRERLGSADDGEAAGLVEFRRKLGQEFVEAQPDRYRYADFVLDFFGESGHRLCRWHA